MKALARLLFELSPLTPFWTALACGFAEIGFDGRVYLTKRGADYLEELK